ncbi:retrovirus-related pol polyprotein from transposon TNT 1-94 [Tanacetum coccineum]
MNDIPYALTSIQQECAMKLEPPPETPKTKTFSEKLPPKEKDPGSFILPCIIGNIMVSNALADLGASISVMPFSMFKRLDLRNSRPVMVIEMADRSMQSSKRIVENVLVKIHKFIFLVDFVILDIVEDNKVPIILGRPMLATAHAIIDIFGRNISLEEITLSGRQRICRCSLDATPFLIDFIILENMNEFVEKGLTEVIFGKPSKEKIGLEEDISKGIIWFKIGDDKTIFNMPRAKRKLSKLTTEQQNLMSPILKISDEDKAKGISHPYQKIKEFYKGCLNLGEEYKQDLEVIDWIKQGHASVHELM